MTGYRLLGLRKQQFVLNLYYVPVLRAPKYTGSFFSKKGIWGKNVSCASLNELRDVM